MHIKPALRSNYQTNLQTWWIKQRKQTEHLLLRDLNIDLFKQPPAHNSVMYVFGFEQVVEDVIGTKSSATLIDLIYTNKRPQVCNVR